MGGDCDGPGDGGNNDGHRGCKGDLICGSNNCLQFGAYYHPKDDCCERPQGVSLAGGAGSGNTAGSPTVTQMSLLRTSVSFSRNLSYKCVYQINTPIIQK